jgi:hypothetical protein
MKPRFDKLVVVRGAASRMAAAAFADASSRVADHEDIAGRLDHAAMALGPETGGATGAALGAQLELSERMRSARGVAQGRIAVATAERDDAAVVRKGARRALDAAVDIRRAERQALRVRREARVVPVVGWRPS